MVQHTKSILLLCGVVLSLAANGAAQEAPFVGIEEHLGEILPVETLVFADEEGKPITLQELFDRPIVLTLVYYRCPGVCTPLLLELVKNVDNCDLTPGKDYRLVTISFDPTETAELARLKKAGMLATLERKQVAPEGWRFLTGDEENTRRIMQAVGFHYMKDKNQVDYIHAATVIFVSPDGKIVRYLNGTEFNPADLKLAVIDASEGRARSFMQKLQNLCYTYDPDARGYVLQLNRIILGITVVFAMGFGGFLLLKGRRRGRSARPDEGVTQ